MEERLDLSHLVECIVDDCDGGIMLAFLEMDDETFQQQSFGCHLILTRLSLTDPKKKYFGAQAKSREILMALRNLIGQAPVDSILLALRAMLGLVLDPSWNLLSYDYITQLASGIADYVLQSPPEPAFLRFLLQWLVDERYFVARLVLVHLLFRPTFAKASEMLISWCYNFVSMYPGAPLEEVDIRPLALHFLLRCLGCMEQGLRMPDTDAPAVSVNARVRGACDMTSIDLVSRLVQESATMDALTKARLAGLLTRTTDWSREDLAASCGHHLICLLIDYQTSGLRHMQLIQPLADELIHVPSRYSSSTINFLGSLFPKFDDDDEEDDDFYPTNHHLAWLTALLDALLSPLRWNAFWYSIQSSMDDPSVDGKSLVLLLEAVQSRGHGKPPGLVFNEMTKAGVLPKLDYGAFYRLSRMNVLQWLLPMCYEEPIDFFKAIVQGRAQTDNQSPDAMIKLSTSDTTNILAGCLTLRDHARIWNEVTEEGDALAHAAIDYLMETTDLVLTSLPHRLSFSSYDKFSDLAGRDNMPYYFRDMFFMHDVKLAFEAIPILVTFSDAFVDQAFTTNGAGAMGSLMNHLAVLSCTVLGIPLRTDDLRGMKYGMISERDAELPLVAIAALTRARPRPALRSFLLSSEHDDYYIVDASNLSILIHTVHDAPYRCISHADVVKVLKMEDLPVKELSGFMKLMYDVRAELRSWDEIWAKL